MTAPTPEPAATCTVCPHPLDKHDATDLRFCHATQSKAMIRGCICRNG